MASKSLDVPIDNIKNEDTKIKLYTCNCSCSNKERKDYVKRAQQNYRLRKIESDPNYREKEKQKVQEYIERNKEQYNENRRLYMREYRARKKNEQAKTNIIQITDGVEAIDIVSNRIE